MKKEIHPPYQEVLFIDSSTGFKFVCGSALQPEKTETFEGKKYPVHYVSISSSSHPFFTGSNKFVDTEGRVNKFLKKYAKKEQQQKEQKKEDQAESSKKKSASKKKSK